MCLYLKSDGWNNSFSSCNNSDKEQWALKCTSSNYFNIINKSDESMCLKMSEDDVKWNNGEFG